MLEAIWNGLLMSITPKVLGLMMIATFIGNFFGAMPGLGGNLALALLIPFIYGWDPFAGLAFLLAMHAIVHTGGAIPSILFAIPGTGPCVATILDGYPMTQQGRAGEAMGAQLAASAVGGVIGAVVLALLIPALRPIAIAFGSPEVFMLIVFGLTFVVVLSRDSIPKGFMSAYFGLLLSTVGLNPHTGVGRLTFDQLWLWDGLNIVPLVLGLFAFAEMMDLGARGRGGRIAEATGVVLPWHQLWKGTVAVFKEWWLTLRTSMIGVVIGIIPGLGGDVATWVCYGHAVQTCKNSENFGKGDIRGVIGVETANNSKEGGALLTTLIFGIPGSSGMAILLGAFLILGVTPGPTFIKEHLDMVWGMVWVLVISNILGAAVLYPLCGFMGKLAYLRGSLLIPPIMVLAGIGAVLIRGFWQDFVFVGIIALIGFGMKKWKYPRPPMILGFILGELAEDYLHKSLAAWGIGFLLRPVCLMLLIMAIASLAYSVWYEIKERKKKKVKPEVIAGENYVTILFLFLFAMSLYYSTQWGTKTRLFPQLIIICGLTASIWQFVKTNVRAKLDMKSEDGADAAMETMAEKEAKTKKAAEGESTPQSELTMVIWLAVFFGLTLLFGFWVSIAVFTVIFLHIFGHEKWKTISVYTICLWGSIFLIFHVGMKAEIFEGWLGHAIQSFSG